MKKTTFFDIHLMSPMQINKEVIFNEAITKIDSICHASVLDFVDDVPESSKIQNKYIVTKGVNASKICYFSEPSKGWQYIAPKKGMVIFVESMGNFWAFNGQNWNCTRTFFPKNQKLMSINGIWKIPSNTEYCYLYLTDDSCIDMRDLATPKVTILIKQNAHNPYKLSWEGNILWQNQQIHKMSIQPNACDIIKFYHIPEFGIASQIIGVNYKI